MGHLTPESYQRLLESPKSEPELYAHLNEGCEVCEQFLAQQPHPLIDGATDAALLSVAPSVRAEDPRAEETYQRIRPKPSAPAARRWVLALAAMLLAVLGAAFLVLRPKEQTDPGMKGPTAFALELQAVVKSADGAVTRVERGQRVPASGTLLIRYHASDAAAGTLVVVRGGKREVLGPVQLEGGTHDLMRDGQLLGLSLEGERGTLAVRIEALSSAAELSVDVGP